MRHLALALVAAAAIFSGCRDNTGVRGYWSSRTPSISDYPAAEEEFAQFAAQAVQAPVKDAAYAVDVLLKKAAEDEVTYYVYTDLIARAFGLIASPCFSCEIFLHAADNILSKGILSPYSMEEFKSKQRVCLYNKLGDKTLLPPLSKDGVEVVIPLEQRTLFLVVDQDCPTCRESMKRLAGPEWNGAWHVALCYGHGPLPESQGWDCYRIGADQEIFDLKQAPFWFVSSPGGKVEIGYSIDNE